MRFESVEVQALIRSKAEEIVGWDRLEEVGHAAALAGESYHVRPHINELLGQAVEQMPDGCTLERESLLSSHGFAFFERPLPCGRRSMRALSWSTHGPAGVLVVCWRERAGRRFYPSVLVPVPFGSDVGEITGVYGDQGEQLDPRAEIVLESFARIATTFLLFVQQKVVPIERRQVPRAERRRAAKSGVDLDREFLVMALRRIEPSKADPIADRQYGVRFPVRAHWHRYRVGESRARVEWRWVPLYYKGPEDAAEVPLVPRVMEVRR
jgi:hypothetical protein